MNTFFFVGYTYDSLLGIAEFKYKHSCGVEYKESVNFNAAQNYNVPALDAALTMSFLVAGTSYYKCFPGSVIDLGQIKINNQQADFLDAVYQEGLSQFAYENKLNRSDLARFTANAHDLVVDSSYIGDGALVLQSGGKDSLLTASLLEERHISYKSIYFSSTSQYPELLNSLNSEQLIVVRRTVDHDGLQAAANLGAKNGHVPVTYILQAYAVVQAVILGLDKIYTSIGHEGEEAHAKIGDLSVTHQWSKTWRAEQMFADYIRLNLGDGIKLGSILRGFSELKIAEMFAGSLWDRFGDKFSSCNVANYTQGHENTILTWCGDCPKCANSYLLFAPFVDSDLLKKTFKADLFTKKSLTDTFKGLLGVDNFIKPFECIGEVDELRRAYQMSRNRGYGNLDFAVEDSNYDYSQEYPMQPWCTDALKGASH